MADAAIPLGAPLPISTAPHRREQPEVDPRIRHVAEEFESVFLNEMMAPMFEGLDTEGLGGGGEGEQMFRPMLIEQWANAISRSGGIGIADNIIAELTRLQSAIQPGQALPPTTPPHEESPDGATG